MRIKHPVKVKRKFAPFSSLIITRLTATVERNTDTSLCGEPNNVRGRVTEGLWDEETEEEDEFSLTLCDGRGAADGEETEGRCENKEVEQRGRPPIVFVGEKV